MQGRDKKNCFDLMLKFTDKKNKVRSFIYCLVIIAGVFCSLYMTTISVFDYFDYKTTVSIHHYQDLQTLLPAITICNMNSFRIEKIGEYFSLNPIGLKKYDACIRDSKSNDWHIKCFENNETEILEYYIRSFRGTIENKELESKRNYSYNLKDDMLISCLYNLKSCNSENFTEIWNRVFGNCYTFGDGIKNPALRASGTGSFLGLILELVICK